MTQRVVILGAGGFAREVLDVFDAINASQPNSYEVLGFISEVEDDWLKIINDKPVLGGFDWFDSDPDHLQVRVICGVGSPPVRHRMIERCKKRGLAYVNAIHPQATMTRRVELGQGIVVTAGVILTNQITIGDHVHLNLHATVGHDARIDDYCTVAPGVNVSGNVHIGVGCDIGTGAAIIQHVSIGEWSVVGAGSVVNREIPANSTAVGVPAKVIKSRKDAWWQQA
ncbi:MAG: acetyltransferase [Planctomycetota bacterium]|jgi:sugar O-acyltransferase (sialic acid O-acetyltransferase NeuD family)